MNRQEDRRDVSSHGGFNFYIGIHVIKEISPKKEQNASKLILKDTIVDGDDTS
jgi:hypothetical protein